MKVYLQAVRGREAAWGLGYNILPDPFRFSHVVLAHLVHSVAGCKFGNATNPLLVQGHTVDGQSLHVNMAGTCLKQHQPFLKQRHDMNHS